MTVTALTAIYTTARTRRITMIDDKTLTVFISGSLSITELSEFAKANIHSVFMRRMKVLIGDAYGADTLIQQMLKSKYDYHFVTVYASNGKARNNIGGWNVKAVNVPNGIYGREFYTYKDVVMSNDCDFGLMIWDGKSQGTLNNIRRLIGLNKESIVCLKNKRRDFQIRTEQQLNDILKEI